MVIPNIDIARRLVDRAVHRNAKTIGDRHGEGSREPCPLARHQLNRQRDDHLPGHDGVPKRGTVDELRAAQQEQLRADDAAATAVVVREAGAGVDNGDAGTIGRSCCGAATVGPLD